MGENGAGKSTLMKCLFGIYKQDAGLIKIDGEEVHFSGPKNAMENGDNTVITVMAGGKETMFRAAENQEDSVEAGRDDLLAKEPKACDVVMGISASGNAAYVASAMTTAKEIGCITISLSSNDDCRIARIADIPIFTDTGAEVITGSTRMKAGNAQKFVLNMISTCAMVKTGKVYENLMINLRPTNIKLRRRMIGIVSDVLEVDFDRAEKLLEENEFSIRKVFEKFGKV